MDLDDFDRFDYMMNDDVPPRRKKASIQPGGCMLVMFTGIVVCASFLLWLSW